MLKTVIAPNELPQSIDLFVAGGISECPDWQSEIILALNELNIVSVNPRRNTGFATTGEMAKEQIKWEHEALNKANAVLFWFPFETLCPITLLELGSAMLRENQKLFVGVHPDYKRDFDVREQLFLQRPEVEIHSTLEELTQEIIEYFS